MEILANIGQERYFQISDVNGVFAGLWVGKSNSTTTSRQLLLTITQFTLLFSANLLFCNI